MDTKVNFSATVLGRRWGMNRDDLQRPLSYGGVSWYSLRKLEMLDLSLSDNSDSAVLGTAFKTRSLLSLFPGAPVLLKVEGEGYASAIVKAVYIKDSAVKGKTNTCDDITVAVSWIYSGDQAKEIGALTTTDGRPVVPENNYEYSIPQEVSVLTIDQRISEISIAGRIKCG